MRKICWSICVAILSVSCYQPQRIELTDEMKKELNLGKPMNITEAEITSVAHAIGDSIMKNVQYFTDTSYTLNRHTIKVIGNNNPALQDSLINNQYEAFAYSLENGNSFPSVVNHKRKSGFVNYQTAKKTSDSTFKMILIAVSIKDVTLKIAEERK